MKEITYRAGNGMLLIRCTQKLLKEMGLGRRAKADGGVSVDSQNEWYANLLKVGRRKYVLFTHAETLFSFLVADARKARLKQLDEVFRQALREALVREGFASEHITRILSSYETIAYDKTISRSVLGSMNDLAFQCEHGIHYKGGPDQVDLDELNTGLNRIPRSAIGYEYAVEKFKAKHSK